MIPQHYTTKQVAALLAVDMKTVTRLFNNEPGVFFLGAISNKRRTRNEIRIPVEVAERVYKRRIR